MGEALATVSQLWRYPVKSMQGERVDHLAIDPSGAERDRRYGVIETATGRVFSAKRKPALLQASAALDGDGVKITLPDGSVHAADDPAVHAVLSGWLGVDVRLEPASAEVGGSYEMGSDPTDDSADTFEFTGPPGSFADLAAAHLLTEASLAAARELYPDGQWDVRRFRPTALLETAGNGFVEDAWVGSNVMLGGATLNVVMPTVRCAMPGRAQPGGLDADADVIRTVNQQHNGNLGVYCWVVAAGAVSVGDPVTAA